MDCGELACPACTEHVEASEAEGSALLAPRLALRAAFTKRLTDSIVLAISIVLWILTHITIDSKKEVAFEDIAVEILGKL